MIKKIIAVFICALMMLSAAGCGNQKSTSNSGKIKVSVTFNALYEFTKAIGKDKVEISTVIPDGTEPHDFEPKPKDLTGIASADVFIYNGLDMETWAKQAIDAAGNSKLIAADASTGITPINDASSSKESREDPHAWVGIKGAETEAQNIKSALVKADPKDKDYYEKNCDEFVSQLEALYNEYNPKFNAAKNKDFVTGHAAFAYFCRDFGLHQESVEDVFADGEPSSQKLSSLVEYCRKNSVKTIFSETMVSPAVSKTLANEVGAKVETIYTFESSEGGKSYIDRMKANLKEIAKSLGV